jgi:transposase InsO family protein
MKNLHKLLKGEHILRLTNVHFEKDRVCSACQAGKQVGVHHPNKNIMTTDRPLELLHMDLFGPIAYINIGESKSCLVIVNDYSRFTWVFFLQEKSQTQDTLKGFLRRAQNEFSLRIKKIRSDNGTEFKISQIEGFLEDEGIKHEFSSPYTPQQNGVVEMKNRTLLDMARTMVDEYKTPDRFWAEVINTACYSINRLYFHRILKKTSYELLTRKKPNVSYFRVFGSKCFILVKRGRKSKFVPKAVEGFLLGYDSNTRAFLNGPIKEKVYVEQPPGFEDSEYPNHVYKLSMVLYGLKQAPRAWYECLRDFLITNGFKVRKADPTLFTKTIAKDLFVCQIYVDDIIFGSTNKSTCEEFSKIMIQKFEMFMMGELKYFLGFQIKQLQDGTFISQTKYIQDILKKFGMKDGKPIKTPMGTNGHLDLDTGGKSVDQKVYGR